MIRWNYTISNRQKKELARGTTLRIAIPVDPQLPDEPTDIELGQWLRDRIPTLEEFGRVRSWVCAPVWCDTHRSDTNQGATRILGPIQRRVDASTVAFSVWAIILIIDPMRGSNGTEHPTQWPGGDIDR